ncbi:putative phospholipase B-like 2 [Amphibalanus amphitrite]|uniref:Phospholipase B-like n=1 Tax=Amphibalanus amphitrite TaxID=1232801 RepID=A0A6A4WLF3_AMPAM|nr:putative phospholipase B-like 2 [Amphibalanus amphitrite]KAF0302701.1 putative phospholipase B-like 2 [Amphibalanus amphitrite]
MLRVLACLLATAAAAGAAVISVTHDAASGNYSVHDGEAAGWVVRANFSDQQAATGWARLEIEGRPSEDEDADRVMAFAAGLAEAHITSNMIADFIYNVVEDICAKPADSSKCAAVNEYFGRNLEWTRKKVESSSERDPYWRQVGLVLSQMDGLQQGIEDTIPGARPDAALWLNAFPDAMDLKIGLPVNKKLAGAEGPSGSDHCSVLVRLLPENADLLVGHNTWVDYNYMSRLLKKVTLPFRSGAEGADTVAAPTVAFSGFPGSIASLDDFHITSAGLVTTETSLDNYNKDLWTFLTTSNSVLQWIRVSVANRVASSGQEWHNAFKRYNSGTYNNQWMIVNYKKFEVGAEGAEPGLLWVTEQMPGLLVGDDVTQVLAHAGYWASYNQPYFPIIDDISGNKRQRAERGDFFSHNKNPRAQLFRRDHVLATNVTSALRLMRHNNFTADPLSSCNCSTGYSADNAIASRRDLNDPDGTYPLKRLGFQMYGAIDAKVTSAKLAERLEFVAEAGPTHDSQPAFQWSSSPQADTVRHRGQPDRWEFAPVDVTWSW